MFVASDLQQGCPYLQRLLQVFVGGLDDSIDKILLNGSLMAQKNSLSAFVFHHHNNHFQII